jgi:hypothetical protein
MRYQDRVIHGGLNRIPVLNRQLRDPTRRDAAGGLSQAVGLRAAGMTQDRCEPVNRQSSGVTLALVLGNGEMPAAIT